MEKVGASIGETQRFECKVIGFPTPTIKWFKDELEITNNLRYDIDFNKEFGTITLVIRNLSLADEGLYQCKAENSEGTASTMTYLVVKVDKLSSAGDDFSSMTVERISEEEHSQVEMQRHGRQTVIEETITRYEENEKEIIEEKLVPPKITHDASLKQPLSIRMGATLSLEVNVSGCPTPTVSWFHGDAKLFNSSRVIMESAGSWSYLKVKSLTEEDAGIIKVKAENSAGQDSAEFRVTVKTPPSAPQNLRVVEVYKDYVVITWDPPSSDGQEKITGYQIEKSLEGGLFTNAGFVDVHLLQYKICRLRDGSSYTFRVMAENRIGTGPPATTPQPVICKLPFDVPGPPRNFTVKECGKDFITVGWIPPDTDGGSKIIQYIVEKRDVTRLTGSWIVAGTVSNSYSDLTFKASKLVQGNAYLFRVAAENQVGVGQNVELGIPIVAKLPFDKPSPPRNLRATETDSSYIVLAWDLPETDGGSPIIGYNIEKRDSKRDEFVYVASVDAAALHFKVTRLFEGNEYYFRIFAENQVGSSLPCEMERSVKAKPPCDEPDAPINLRVKDYWIDFITVLWDPPKFDGGSPIVAYVVEKRETDRTTWVKAGQVAADVTAFKATGLFEGSDYFIRVFAVNKIGASKEAALLSQPCRTKMPFDPPFAPRKLQVVEYNIDHVILSWEEPEFDGGSPINNYFVEKRDALMNIWSQAGKTEKDTRRLKVVNLYEGQSYYFRVCAENQCDRGPFVDTLKPVTAKLPYDKPSKPLNLRVTDIWKDYITITWEEPESDGGCPLTGYVIEQRDAYEVGNRFVANVGANTLMHQVTNLCEGHDYYFRVFSQNAAGLSEVPAEIKPPVKARLPYDVPSPPVNLRVTDIGDGLISIAWDAPVSDGGSPVTGYMVETCRSGSTTWNPSAKINAGTLAADLAGLTVGDYYFIRVFSENLAGISKRPADLNETICCKKPISPPGPPRNLRVTDVTSITLTITWDAPKSDGSSDVAQYFIEMKEEQALDFVPVGRVDGRTNSFTSEFMQRGKQYRFRVKAKNSAGFSEPADLQDLVQLSQAVEVPSVPLNLRATGTDNGAISIAWDVPSSDGGSPVTGYIVETCPSGSSNWSKAANLDDATLSCNVKGLVTGNYYFVRVYAANKIGLSKRAADLYEPLCAKKPLQPPGTPLNLRVSDITTNNITITWEPAPTDGSNDAAHFFIDLKEENDFDYTPAGRVDGRINSFTSEFLQKGKLYKFRVRGKNSAGYSEPAAELPTPVQLKQALEVPSVPLNLRVTGVDDGAISITWDVPKSDGGSPISGYIIETCQSGNTIWNRSSAVDGTTLASDLKGLKAGDYYFVRVYAQNEIGISKRSADLYEPVCAKKPTKPPGKPLDLKIADVTSSTITITWNPPPSDGSSDVAQYFIDAKDDKDLEYFPAGRTDGRNTSYTAEFLQKDKLYRFQVRAKNSAGFSEPAETENSVQLKEALDVPSAPQNLRATDVDNGAISIAWDVPTSNGGAAISGYIIECCQSGSTSWKRAATVDGATLTFDLKGLQTGDYYFIRVFAQNAIGVGKRAADLYEPVCAKRPTHPPDTPVNLRVTNVTTTAVTMSWDANSGGSEVSHYFIDTKEENGADYSPAGRVDGRINSFTTEFLQKGVLYRFRVRAKNSAGFSEPPAELSELVQLKEAVDVPSPPQNLRVTGTDDGLISVAWDTPKSDGGSSITGYAVEQCKSGSTVWNPAAEVDKFTLAADLKNLAPGDFYFVRVYSENEVGKSRRALDLYEPVCAKKPSKPPSTPVNLRVSDLSTTAVSISWDKAEDSAEVTQYYIDMKEEDDAEYTPFTQVDGKITSITTEFLRKGRRYRFRVRAKNSAGFGEPPAELQESVVLKTAYNPPSSPENLRVTDTNDGSITVAWSAPMTDGGTPVTGYVVEVCRNGSNNWTKALTIEGATMLAEVRELVDGDNYLIRVYAENEAGLSENPAELSESVCAKKPTKPPGCPTNVRVTDITTSTISVSWEAPLSNGDAEVAQYLIEMKDNKSDYLTVGRVDNRKRNYTAEFLQKNRKYKFRVKAKNSAGLSEAGEILHSVELLPAVVAPGPPCNFHVVETTGDSVTLAWSPPESSGGAVIKQYIVNVREASKNKFRRASKVIGDTLTCTINTGLELNQEYLFKIFAENEVGVGFHGTELKKPVKIMPKKVEEKIDVVDSAPTVEEPVEKKEEKKQKKKKKEEKVEEVAEKKEVEVKVEEKMDASQEEVVLSEATAASETVVPPKKEKKEKKPKEKEPKPAEEVQEEIPAPVQIAKEAESAPLPVPLEPEKVEIQPPKEAKVEEKIPEVVKKVPSGFKDGNFTELCSESVTLVWEHPLDNGGVDIINYIIVMRESDKNKYKKIGQVDGSSLAYKVTKVKEGHEYFFRIYAENSVGISTESAEVKSGITIPKRKKEKKVKEVVEEVPEVKEITKVEEVIEAVKEVEVKKEEVKEIPKEVKEIPKEVKEIPKEVKEIPKEVKEIPKEVKEIPKEVKEIPKEVKEIPKEVKEIPKEVEHVEVEEKIEEEEEVEIKKEVREIAETEVVQESVEETKAVEEKLEQHVGVKPSFEVKPEPVTVKEGGSIRLECKVAGEPTPEVSWYKGKKHIKSSKKDKRIKISFDEANKLSKLQISEAVIEDSGEYTIKIGNESGSASAAVSVQVSERFSTRPIQKESTVVEEFDQDLPDRAVITEEVIQKKKKKSKEEKQKKEKLKAEEVEAKVAPVENEAVAEEEEEEEEEEEVVEYTEEEFEGPLPLIEVKPEPTTVKEGETIRLVCKVADEPSAEVTWLKKGQTLKAVDDKRLRVGFEEITGLQYLEIVEASFDDVGDYTLNAESEGGIIACTVSVNVVSKIVKLPPKLEEYPKPQIVKEGEKIELSCKISGEPLPEVSFFKNDKPVQSGDSDGRVTVAILENTCTLTVNNAIPEDSGEYNVVAKNERGKICHAVTVNVQPEGVEYAETGVIPAEFITKLQPVKVVEGEPVKLTTVVQGSDVSISWFKDGKPLKVDENLSIGCDGENHFLELTNSKQQNSGEYTCTASNAAGSAFCTANVKVLEPQDADYELIQKLSTQIQEERLRRVATEGDEMLFKKYPMLGDYTCKDKNVHLSKGDIIEVMDMEKETMWLVRLENDKQQVCYVPVELILGLAKKDEEEEEEEEESEEESEEEEEEEEGGVSETFPVYIANTQYKPSQPDELALEEGDLVEVLDSKSPDRWFCRKVGQPNVQGWVPPSYLVPKSGEKLDTRSTQEVFREDIIKISNKEQEAVMKRRYAIKDLWESEKEYVRDLTFVMDNYFKVFEGSVPDELSGKRDLLFSTFPEIFNFHNDIFLDILMNCTNDADNIADAFLNNIEQFQQYVPYFKGRNLGSYLLEHPSAKQFLKEHDMRIGNIGDNKLNLPQYMDRPWDRVDEYIAILKDILRYTTKANQSTTKLEQAIKMLLDLRKQADDQSSLDHIVGYIGDLSELGPVQRHDDFIVWEGEPTVRGKDRHLFLFKNKLLITKKKKAEDFGELPTYEFRSVIELPETLLNEELNDNRRFELCYEDVRKGKYTFQARTAPVKQAWCDLLRRWLRKWGEKPGFTTRLDKVSCIEGMPVKMRCKLEGQPIPEVKWYFNDNLIQSGNDYTIFSDLYEFFLMIPRSTLDMSGKYSVRAKNKYGEMECNTTLTVEEELLKPNFSAELDDCEVLLGAGAKFSCRVGGKPEPKIKWFKDGIELETTDRCKFLSTDSQTWILILTRVEESDLGVYECRATSKAGTLSSKARLVITDLEERKRERAPEFLSNFADIVTVEGKETKLSLRIAGYPSPKVNWLFDGRDIVPSDYIDSTYDEGKEACFYLRIARPEHTGKYTCCLSNKFGTAEVTASVTVATKPVISSKFSDLEKFIGESARFACKYTGFPKPDVTWYHNKHVLTDTERIKIERTDDEVSLTIDKVLKPDDGQYSCRLSNAAGETSCFAKLFTQMPIEKPDLTPVTFAPSFTKRLQNQDILLGSMAKFVCKAIGEPKPEVHWFKNKKPLQSNDRMVIDFDDNAYRLIIHEVTEDDVGCYHCTVINSAGQASSVANLNIETPKEEVPEAKKEKEQKLYNVIPSMSLDKPLLRIIDYNNMEISWQPATLPPKAKPTPISYIIERKDLGRGATDWIQIFKSITETVYMISGYSPEKDCLYRIRAENEFGISDPSMSSTYYGKQTAEIKDDLIRARMESRKERLPPRAPRDKPIINEIKDDALELTWLAAEFPDYAVVTDVYYIIERRCPPSKNWLEIATDVKDTTFIMKEYRPEKDYMFRIRAGNDYGVSDPSMSSTIFAKFEIEHKKEKPGDEYKSKVKPRTIWDRPDIVDVKPDSFTLKWKPSSVPQYAVQTPVWYIVEQRIPPSLEWTKLASDVSTNELKVTKYSLHKDYYFRVKAANEFGVAEPSMPAMLRKREDIPDETDDSQARKKKEPKEEEYIPTHRVPDHMRIIPEFLGESDDTQYGVEGRTSEISFRIRAYPDPKVTWYFHNNKIELGDKFTGKFTSKGEITLVIHDFTWAEVGEYKAECVNQFGTATRTIKMDMSDPPTFLEPMKDQVFHLHMNGKMECRVHGIPYPKVMFKKDWRPIAGSHRVKIVREEYDHWTLNIQNAIHMDEGVYECIAENVAGKVYCTASVKITEKTGIYRDIKFNSVPVEDYFHIIDEIGRGSYGVIRRVIDKNSGNQYAAKFMRYSDLVVKDELMRELEMMSLLDHHNIAQVIDGYEDKKRLAIVMEIITGGELLGRLIKEDSLTESEAAFFLRQLLLAVEYMHAKSVLHLDLRPENLLLLSPSSDELKVIDFGFSRRYNPSRKLHSKYGTPEFISPEIARDETVTPAADLWSVGIISYILLSGISPFHKETQRETLSAVKKGQWQFDSEAFADISIEARDFISKLLELDPKKRMSATEAIDHPFLELANHRGLGNRISTERHKAYMFRRKIECGASCVKTIVLPRPLSQYVDEFPSCSDIESAVNVPTLQLPGMDDSDLVSENGSASMEILEVGPGLMLQELGPPHLLSGAPSVIESDASSDWGREYEDEDTWYEYSSAYQTGPDTRLFPSKDTGLSVRMAKYRRSSQLPSVPRPPSIRSSMKERRDLRDLDKELEMEDMPSTSTNRPAALQLKKMMLSSAEGFPPIFKEKIHDKAYNVGDSCTLKVFVIGSPVPLLSWFRNEELLNEGGRVRIVRNADGRHSLTILQTKPNDFGVYKCVARNKYGTVTCRARMLCGDHPSRPGRPHVTMVSDREVFMIWEEPETDGNSYIQAYKVDWFRPGDQRWTTATYCIDECALIKSLKPDTSYRFRTSAINKFGQSPYSWASIEIRTKKKGAPSLEIDDETKRILLRSRQAASRPSPEPSPTVSPFGSVEDLAEEALNAKMKEHGMLDREVHLQETDPAQFLTFTSEIWRGRFSIVRNVQPKEGKKANRVAKITTFNPASPKDSLQEYEMLKSVNQEQVVRLYEAYVWNDFVFLIFEKLYGENVVRSISLKNKYDEYMVTSIIKQVLDALQFLHHRGIVHLNIQPDNVIMQSRRRFDIKLVDFGQAQKITSVEGEKVSRVGTAEFMAPEKVARENVGVAADVWGVGVLAFILLSGVSPFYADSDEDTYLNIKHIRYDAHALYHNVTKFCMKFLYQTLRRNPKSRLTIEECLEHRWLMLHHIMVKSRKAASFSTDKLKYFLDEYISRRMRNAHPSAKLVQSYGNISAFGEDDEEEYFANRRLSTIRF